MGEESLALALGALGRKERSVAEMGRWLCERGVGEEEVEELVDRLIAIGALDDRRFAAHFAEDKRELAGWGRERIRAALLERGITAEDVELAIGGDGGELERAVELLRRRGADLGDDRGRGRALAMLMRRGYEADTAYEAVRRAAQPD